MRVLTVAANTERINLPTLPLGAALVAAAAEARGHDVAFLDLMGKADPECALRREIDRVRPDAIGVSVRNIDDQCRESPRFLLATVKEVVDACRACSAAPVVLGGAGYSIFPEAALAYLGADLGVAGDGEVAFPALLDRLAQGADPAGLPGVVVPGGETAQPEFPHDLDGLPLWDSSLAAVADPADPELWIPVQSRRGCPNDCSYCSTASIQGSVGLAKPKLSAGWLQKKLRMNWPLRRPYPLMKASR